MNENPIYALIPAIYKQRDALLGRPLEALTEVLDLEYQALRADVGVLYEEWFIETCDRWVVPYIGSLLGIAGIETETANVPTQRARVANTLGYRSRRGVAAILANACADASGWPAVAVEYFQRVVLSENVDALALPDPTSPAANLRLATVDVSNTAALAQPDGPFSTLTRTVDVADIELPRVHRSATSSEYFNLPNIGLFMWRIQALPIERASPGASSEYRTFHPLGIDTPLWFAPQDRTSPWTARTRDELPLAITRRALRDSISSWRRTLAGKSSQDSPPELGFVIRCGATAIPAEAIFVDERGSLEPPEQATPPDGPYAYVDPERGRFIVYGCDDDSTITVDWAWGQPAWLGGGSYDRNQTMVEPGPTTDIVLVSRSLADTDSIRVCRDLDAATERIQALRLIAQDQQRPLEVLIRIVDSATYEPPRDGIELFEDDQLVIQALDGERPCIASSSDARTPLRVTSGGLNARLTLSGLLLGGPVELGGDMEVLIIDSTIAPLAAREHEPERRFAIRWAADESEAVSALAERELQLVRSIVGPLEIAASEAQVIACQTILDGGDGLAVSGPTTDADPTGLGAPLILDAATVLGSLRVTALDAVRDSIIDGRAYAAAVERRLLDDHEFELELGLDPTLTPNRAGDRPTRTRFDRPEWLPSDPFTSTRYGDPGYCQLRLEAGTRLLRQASGDREYGAYHELATGQRLANLVPVIDQYVPNGLAAGILLMN